MSHFPVLLCIHHKHCKKHGITQDTLRTVSIFYHHCHVVHCMQGIAFALLSFFSSFCSKFFMHFSSLSSLLCVLSAASFALSYSLSFLFCFLSAASSTLPCSLSSLTFSFSCFLRLVLFFSSFLFHHSFPLPFCKSGFHHD